MSNSLPQRKKSSSPTPNALVQTGGPGDNVFFVNNSTDTIVELANGGRDVVYASVSWSLNAGAHVEVISAANQGGTAALTLAGNEFDQDIYGNAGANLLQGGGGSDYLVGLEGDDSYIVVGSNDRIVELAGQGRDVLYALGNYTLAAGASIEVLSTGNQAATFSLELVGNELNQDIYGNAGSNLLEGGGGVDYLVGLTGDDNYIVNGNNDHVVEVAGEGRDVVYTRGDYTLDPSVSVEILSAANQSGTTAMRLTGSSLDQEIYGNAGANVLDGGGGTDYMGGLGGNDTYFVNGAGDHIIEAAGQGTRDVVYARASYALEADQDIEVLAATQQTATTAMNLTGNNLVNEVYGNDGVNIINGGGGSDFLAGYGGADIFAFTTALGATNIDQILDFTVGSDTIQLAGAAGNPFSALATGTLAGAAFVIGTAAADANDYLIYNSGTGALLYDADGNGAGAAVQFATLSTGLALTAASFTVSGPANNAPVVTSGATASIAENSAASTIVYQAVATDADGDRITYSLTGVDAALLTIDANGAVRLLNPADFETKNSYSFNVVASDSATSTPRAVTLTITNVAEAATAIINETAAANDSTAAAQMLDRNLFTIANNPNLPDASLPSATIVGDLPTSGDRDFFAITLQAGEKLILDVDNSSGNLDTLIRVYSSAGVEIGSNDDPGGLDTGSAPHPTYGHNTDSFFSFRATTAGTYYFSIEPFQDPTNPTSGSYEINVSIGPVATQAQLIAEDIDALISGSEWDHTDLTFGFPTSPTQYPSTFKEVDPFGDFQAFSGVQQAATRLLLQLVSNVSTLTFTELTGGTGTASGAGHADLRYAMSRDADVEVAYAYYPTNAGPTSAGGSAWFNLDDFNLPVRGNYAWMGILHETGHALGLKHGHEPPAISADRDSVEYSVMTYRSYPGQDISDGGGYTNARFGYPQTLMMYDIAALQEIYGPNYVFNSGNSTYTWDPLTGETFINGQGQGQPGFGDPNATPENSNRVFMTIWDGGGTDTYDLSAYANATTIDLRPGEWTTTSTVQLAHLGPGHDARGNVANALMYHNNTDSLIENAVGGFAGDTIIANQAANVLTGNGGADTFTWKAGADAGTGTAADTIADFLRGSDKIGLSDIDAISGTTGTNDAFSFIGLSAFHNVAGELRYQVEGANLRIQGDFDGNGVADFEIVLNGNTIIAASDFFL